MRRQRSNKQRKTTLDNDTQEPSEELPTLKEIIENRAIEGERPMSKNFTLQTVLGGDILTAAILRRKFGS